MSMKTTCRSKQRYEARNLEAATVILSDSATYPEGSALARWAELWLFNHTPQPEEGGQLRLFEKTEAAVA